MKQTQENAHIGTLLGLFVDDWFLRSYYTISIATKLKYLIDSFLYCDILNYIKQRRTADE